MELFKGCKLVHCECKQKIVSAAIHYDALPCCSHTQKQKCDNNKNCIAFCSILNKQLKVTLYY